MQNHAEEFQSLHLAVAQRVFGPDHVPTIDATKELGFNLFQQRRYAEAEIATPAFIDLPP